MASVCNICADNLFAAEQDISAVSCGHMFHRSCLDQWWTKKQTCPNCRSTCKLKVNKLYFQNFEFGCAKSLKLKNKELENTVKKSKEEMRNMESEYQETTNMLLELVSNGSQLEDELSKSKSECCDLRSENDVMKARIKELQTTEKKLKQQMKRMTFKIEMKNEKLSKRPTLEQLEKLRTIVSDREIELCECMKQIYQLQMEDAGKIPMLIALCEALEIAGQKINKLENCVSRLKSLDSALHKELRECQRNAAVREEKYRTTKDENEHLLAILNEKSDLQMVPKENFETILKKGNESKKKRKRNKVSNAAMDSEVSDRTKQNVGVQADVVDIQNQLKHDNFGIIGFLERVWNYLIP